MWVRSFSDPGAAQSWTVPPDVSSITVVANGAQGGGSGLGGCEKATVPVKAGESLLISIGGQGSASGRGGANGGGNGGAHCCNGSEGGGGGGATDIREGGATLQNRIVVAGGGGGSSGDGWFGGTGGGETGGNGYESTDYPRGYGHGGTQTQGGEAAAGATAGTLGTGGLGGVNPNGRFGGGGGGGGYYGGGGGRYSHHDDASNLDDGDSGGGGGSGFVESSASDVVSANGVHYGNGLVKIAWPQITTKPATGLNNPLGIAVDDNGNVFVTTSDGKLQELRPDGTLHTAATFHQPAAVAAGSDSSVYVSDMYDQAIYKVSSDGSKSIVVNQVKADALAIDGNNDLYFTDRCGSNCGVLKVLTAGKISKVADLYNPESIAVDAHCTHACTIYETEDYHGFFGTSYFYFYTIDSNGFKIQVTLGSPSPTDVAVDESGAAYVVDGVLRSVAKYTFGSRPVRIGSNWSYPTGIAVRPSCKAVCPVYVTDYENGWIVEVR